ALGGEVEVAAAVRPDRAGFLAFDVALEPGGVDGLDEEFLGLLVGQAGVPFPDDRTRARTEDRPVCRPVGIYHRTPRTCTTRHAVRARDAPSPKLTPVGVAATLAPRWSPTGGGARASGCGRRDGERIQLPGARPRPRTRQWSRHHRVRP